MRTNKTITVILTSLIMAVNVNAQLTNKLITTAAHWNYQILGGELSNSAATSVNDIDEVLPRMKALGLNTVLVPIYWEFLEPAEGQMDFTLVDRTIDVARQQGLKIVPLWFGVWKNSGVRALYAFGEHQALGFSPFAIDQASPKVIRAVTPASASVTGKFCIFSSTNTDNPFRIP